MRFRPVDQRSLVTFFRSLSAMVSAGVPLRRAINVSIERCPNERLCEALESISSDIETGSSLSASMARRGNEFSRLLIMMIRAAEAGGILDLVLERIAQLLERDRALRARIYTALTYPGIVAFASIGLILFLLANTMPSFSSMFAQMHVELPPSTVAFIVIGRALQNPQTWLLMMLGACMAVLIARAAHAYPAIAEGLDGVVLRIPAIGNVIAKSNIARFSRTLGTMLGSGVTLEQGLDAARDVMSNRV
ncbi:MAG: type II secretion system F family protein, partial [Vulcanimicrobiaceae bacterium]